MIKHKNILIIFLAILVFLVGNMNNSFATDEDTIYLKDSRLVVERGAKVKNKLKGAIGKIKWISSNKKIATVSTSGVIKGNKLGKCTVTAKYKGQIFRCKVRVVRAKPNFDAKIVAVVNKSKPYIKVRFRNFSKKPLTVQKYVKYRDYTEPTYKLKRSKNCVIKGHKSKTIKFINYGKYEIWNFAGRQDPDVFAEALSSKLYFKFKFDGKKYSGKTYWYYVEAEDGSWIDKYKSVYGNGAPTLAKKR